MDPHTNWRDPLELDKVALGSKKEPLPTAAEPADHQNGALEAQTKTLGREKEALDPEKRLSALKLRA